MSEVDWKERARQQWSADPCGSTTASKAAFGSREYFQEIERVRYETAPWMKRDLGFDRYPGKKLLEVGVGMGSDHVQWARGGAICTGIDLTPRCIEITRDRFQLEGLKSDLRVMDAERLEFPSESFDVVYSFGVLHHTPNTQRAIDEIHRVLVPGGRAIVMLYHRESWYWWRTVLQGVWGDFEKKTLHDMLGEGEDATDRKALPLVKVYSRPEALFLFRRFAGADAMIRQLTRHDLQGSFRGRPAKGGTVWADRTSIGPLPFLPLHAEMEVTSIDPWRALCDGMTALGETASDRVIEELGQIVGWNLVVTAEK